MHSFILILSTVVRDPKDLQSISDTLDQFMCVKWTIDLDDSDHVLRVCSNKNIAQQIVEFLEQYGISSKTLGIFKT